MNTQRKGKIVPLRRVAGSPDEMSDEALVAACAVGEAAALGALFDRHHQPVYRFISRVLGPADDIDDLAQSTFIEVWRSAGRFKGKGSVRSWIFGIAANVARHHIRTEVRRRAAMQGVASGPAHDPPRPDDIAARRELVHRVGEALDELSHDLRVAFVLCDIESIPGVDAARALGIRKGTLWRRLHDARKALRTALDGRPR